MSYREIFFYEMNSPPITLVAPITLVVQPVGGEECNTSNHWATENRLQPKDYDRKLQSTYTNKWIDYFHSCYTIINITVERWMLSAQSVSEHTGGFSPCFVEELRDYKKALNLPEDFWAEPKFLRTDTVSFKSGKYGIGPYHSTAEMLMSMCTCKTTHNPLHRMQVGDKFKIYVLPWKKISPDLEFRVFIHNKKVVAISQQHIYEVLFTEKDFPERIENIVKIIVGYFDTIKHYPCFPENFTIDLALIRHGNFSQRKNSSRKNLSPYFIEMNGFGADYPAGSALFHWRRDEDILLGKKESIYFRYVKCDIFC